MKNKSEFQHLCHRHTWSNVNIETIEYMLCAGVFTYKSIYMLRNLVVQRVSTNDSDLFIKGYYC